MSALLARRNRSYYVLGAQAAFAAVDPRMEQQAALRRVLASPWLLSQLDSLPGYDPSRCGQYVASW